ncbi:hypothetical protein TNCV_3106761 [Trichonephila clavipes]|nr:hypothetical protein TNCV_3106761 [Trichonephila clavipes]
MASDDSDKWLAAMKWVFKVKQTADGNVQCFKARLVAKGCSRKFGVYFNETFSPVVWWNTIKTALSIAAA